MMREIILRPPEGENIRSEFFRLLKKAEKEGWNELTVLPGFAWDHDWVEELMTPEELLRLITNLENDGLGKISDDDLFVTIVAIDVQYTFCHENDIHIKGNYDDPFIQKEQARFRALLWEVSERK